MTNLNFIFFHTEREREKRKDRNRDLLVERNLIKLEKPNFILPFACLSLRTMFILLFETFF